ncbi:MAG: class I SAM-dependent methyltransferase [Thermomicrobiales bacterium]
MSDLIDRPTSFDPYADIAELYDLEHDAFDDDLELYLGLLDNVGGPFLEMGAGSGRLLAPVADAGYAVTGLDASKPMLDRARARLKQEGLGKQAQLFQGQMADAASAPGGPFGLIAFSLNALMHLDAPETQRAALRAAREAMKPDGITVIDTMNPTLEQLSHLVGRTHLEGSWELEDGSTVDKWSHRDLFSVDQTIDTLLYYDRTAPDGAIHRTRSSFILRYVTPNELEMMLELAGFSRWQIYGGYDLSPLSDDSDRIIAIAEGDAPQ